MKKILLYSAGIGLLGFSLYKYFTIQAEILKNFKYEISGITFKALNGDQIAFNVRVKFISQSAIEAVVTNLYLNILFEGTIVGNITNVKPFNIPAMGTNFIDLSVNISTKLLLGNLINIVSGASAKKDMNIGLNGYATIKSGFIGTNLPIDYTTTANNFLIQNSKK